jgi:dihydrofolate reductase
MGKIVLDITMSLDGFVAGTNPNAEQPLGQGGERLHDWMFKVQTDSDTAVIDEVVKGSGAVIVGKRTYADGLDTGWNGVSPFEVPAFVLTHNTPTQAPAGFTFVTDGIESAIAQAKAVAGDKNIWVMGGANIAQQFIKAGLVDEMHIHIAPVLFGEGTRLFEHIGTQHIELERIQTITTPGATHLRFRVLK